MKTQTYPTYQDIKEQLSREDLLEIIEAALDTKDIEGVIADFIESEFSTYEEMEDIA